MLAPWVDVQATYPLLPVPKGSAAPREGFAGSDGRAVTGLGGAHVTGHDDAARDARLHLLRGRCRAFHYGCDGVRDNGWGCGYRTLQTMVSWVLANAGRAVASGDDAGSAVSGHYGAGAATDTETRTPSLRRIQEVLAVANAGKRGHRGFVGSTEWISTEDAFVYLAAVHGVQSRVLTLRGGAPASDVREVAQALAEHFDRGDGPVMIGGTDDHRSRACVGVYFARETGDFSGAAGSVLENAWLLVLDPHFSGSLDGATDADGNLDAAGARMLGCHYEWETLGSLTDGWHNLCCPAPSLGIVEPTQDAGAGRDNASSSEESGFDIVVEASGFDNGGAL